MRSPLVAVLAPYAVLVAIAVALPLDEMLYVGGNEWIELSKILLAARHPEALPAMWNDQPWLHTLLNGWLMRGLGEHAAIPRVFTLVSVGVLFLALAWMGGSRLGFSGGLVTATTLVTSWGWLSLSMSAVIGLPAFCWAVFAAAWFLASRGKRAALQALSAGALLGLAVHLKLTALMIVPAAVAAKLAQAGWRRGLTMTGWAVAGWGIGFGVGVMLSPYWDWGLVLGNHIEAVRREAGSYDLREAVPTWAAWVGCLPLWCGAAVGLAGVSSRRESAAWVFGVVFLVTALVAAVVVRPWRAYYLVHLQIPAALLAGLGWKRLMARWREWKLTGGQARSGLAAPAGVVLPGAALVALVVGFGLLELRAEWRRLRAARLATVDDMVSAMRRYAPRTRWCFTSDYSRAFFAGVTIPPEVLVLVPKRFASGALDEMRLRAMVQRRSPEMCLLRAEAAKDEGWARWLEKNYVAVLQFDGEELWVHGSLDPRPLGDPWERLRALGF